MRKCPSCGKSDEEEQFIKTFCKPCYVAHFNLAELPTEIEISRCAVCGRVKIGHDWVEENKKAIKEVVEQKLKSTHEFQFLSFELRGRQNAFDATLAVLFSIGSEEIELNFTTLVKFVQTQCQDCSKKHGGYYDSIIQVRSKEERVYSIEKMEAKVKKIEKLVVRRGGWIRKVEKTETGYDVLVAGITPAMQSSHDVCDQVKHTRKLIGRKNGKDLYRHTFCLRL